MPDERNAAATEHADRVREMFANIAARYDLLNHLLSGNVDKKWRRRAARMVGECLPPTNARVLDVACGTGDLSLMMFETTGASVIGSDFCRPMLEIAARKVAAKGAIPFIEGDALRLPFQEGSFDAASIAFGLRNLADAGGGLEEIYRILRPGGWVAVLEFSKPVIPGFSLLFHLYFTKVLPLLGGLVSGSRRAYEYLPNSVSRFMDQEELADLMRKVGFGEVRFQNFTGGIAALHMGQRPR